MRVVSKTGTDRLVDFITAVALAWPSNRLGLRVIVSLCVRGTRGAIRVTLDDLQILIQEGEGTTLEFKESLSASFARELVALANTIGGKVLLGVRDNGTVVGVQDTNTLRARIQDIARNCDPPVQVRVELVGRVFAVHVRESDSKPVQCSDGFFWRQGAVTQTLSRDEIRDLFRLEGAVRFDLAPCVRFSYPEDFDREKFDVWLSLSGITGRRNDQAANPGIAWSQARGPLSQGVSIARPSGRSDRDDRPGQTTQQEPALSPDTGGARIPEANPGTAIGGANRDQTGPS